MPTYHWQKVLPEKHERTLYKIRPEWFEEWFASHKAPGPLALAVS